MDMQVSWIDADRLKALVAQIAPEETRTEAIPSMVEIDTVPETLPETTADAWGFAMNWTEPSPPPAPAAMEKAEPPPAESEPPKPQADLADEPEIDVQGPSLHNAAAALPLSRIRDKLRAIRQRASAAGILSRPSEAVPVPPVAEEKEVTPPPPADEEEGEAPASDKSDDPSSADAAPACQAARPQAPVFEIPLGSRDVRLEAFAGWARQVLREDDGQVLVMSDDGEVLWGGEARAGLVLSTMMACGAAIRASAMSACETPPMIHQPLASGNVLTVIPCETTAGMVHAAVAAHEGLTHEQAHILRGALCAAMN